MTLARAHPCPNCGCGSCVILTDDFDGDNGDPFDAAKWTSAGGSASATIQDNTLEIVRDGVGSSKNLRSDAVYPGGLGKCSVKCGVTGVQRERQHLWSHRRRQRELVPCQVGLRGRHGHFPGAVAQGG